jgi:hypothetical protein
MPGSRHGVASNWQGASMLDSDPNFGAVAQLGERRVRNAKVGSSILLRSTIIQRSDMLRPGSLAPKPRFLRAFLHGAQVAGVPKAVVLA